MTAHDEWVQRDAQVVWHGFTQMATFAENSPIIVERAEGRELIDIDGNRYLDAISSLWVTTRGHPVTQPAHARTRPAPPAPPPPPLAQHQPAARAAAPLVGSGSPRQALKCVPAPSPR